MKLLSDSMMDRVSVEDIGGKPMTKSVNEKDAKDEVCDCDKCIAEREFQKLIKKRDKWINVP